MSPTLVPPMAKDPQQSNPQRPAKTTTKVEAELMRMARTVAASRDIDVQDYIDTVLRPVVTTDYDALTSGKGAKR